MSQFKNTTGYIGSELLHTPGGVRDTYGVECENKLNVAGKVHDVMKSYGFDDIQTPAFEYFDIFSKERGTASSKEMFKFFDRGNTSDSKMRCKVLQRGTDAGSSLLYGKHICKYRSL